VTKASEESDRIPNGCKETFLFLRRGVIDQTRIHVEQFSKIGKKQWTLREYEEEDEAMSGDKPLRVYALASVPFNISLQDLYNKVKFEQEGESGKC
jgi:hypothetical protein